ncbi:MAG: hypothetical protein ACSW8D_03220 [Prevotella sp.]
MYQSILQALKKRFEGVNENILARIAKNLEKNVKTEDEVQAAVDGVTVQQLLENHGDYRATEATKTAVSNYEKKHNLKDGEKVKTPATEEESGKTVEEGGDTPPWAKALIESNKKLSEKVSKLEGEKLNSERKARFGKVIAGLPEELRKGYERITLDTMEDEKFDNLLQEVETEVKGIQQNHRAKGAVTGRPTASTGSTDSSAKPATKEEVDDVMKQIKI